MNEPKRRKTQVVGVSLTQQSVDYVEHLLEDKGFVSKSEVFRRAIEFYHEKTYPNYIFNRSATDIAKRATLEKNNDLEELSDLQYARKYLPGGLFYEGENTQSHEIDQNYLIFDEQGLIRPWPLKNVKRYFAQQKNHVNAHKDAVKTQNISDALDEKMCKILKDMWLINIPEHYEEELE